MDAKTLLFWMPLPRNDGYYWHRVSKRHSPTILRVTAGEIYIGTFRQNDDGTTEGEWTRKAEHHGGQWWGPLPPPPKQ